MPTASSIATVAEAVGLTLDGGRVAALEVYLDLLQRWNRVYNLTSIRDPDRMLTHHLADCLATVAPLRRELASVAGRRPRLIDVGSGGGLPGAVVAIVCPDFDVVCVDSVGKKAAFVQQVAAELQLSRLGSRHERIEQLGQMGADLVMSRAFATLLRFTSVSDRCLAPNGRWMAMKGKRPVAEIDALPESIVAYRVEELVVPGLAEDRCLVWLKRGASAHP